MQLRELLMRSECSSCLSSSSSKLRGRTTALMARMFGRTCDRRSRASRAPCAIASWLVRLIAIAVFRSAVLVVDAMLRALGVRARLEAREACGVA